MGSVVVTGGAGFIGSHVVDALLARSQSVIVVDDLSTGHRRNLAAHDENEMLTFLEGDVADDLCSRVEGEVDAVVHLAAQVSVVRSLADPLADLRSNVRGTVQVLELAKAKGAKVVFASSAAVYGDVATVPTPEDATKEPLSPYGADKLASELWLGMYSRVHGVATTPLRFFNVYGPRQDPSSAYSGVISIFLERVSRGAPITIYGDGEQTRDFIFVADVVRAILAAVDHKRSTPALNVGTGGRVSVSQLAQEVLRALETTVEISHGEARTGDIRHSQAVVSQLSDVLGVRAATSFADGLAETARWYQHQAEV
ncbi:MAG: NAD-dependent epimerase/dehydratase family protein [Myxococcota bacterium]